MEKMIIIQISYMRIVLWAFFSFQNDILFLTSKALLLNNERYYFIWTLFSEHFRIFFE